MTNSSSSPLEKLTNPPLAEVAAAFYFEDIVDLEPVARSLFWSRVADRYPNRELRHAIEESRPILRSSPGPARTWLVSDSGEMLLQIQHDRMILNWRSMGVEYPRFSSPQDGVRDSALAEFESLSAFSEEVLGVRPAPSRVEVLKVDHLHEQTHWRDDEDLLEMVPALRGLAAASPFVTFGDAGLRLGQSSDSERLRLNVDMVHPPAARILKIETVCSLSVGAGMTPRQGLDMANRRVNGLFEWLIPRHQRDIRFQGG